MTESIVAEPATVGGIIAGDGGAATTEAGLESTVDDAAVGAPGTLVEVLAVPEVAFLLLAAGLLALAIWLALPQPLTLAVAVAGGVPLTTGLLGLIGLPASPASVVLIVLGASALALEVLCLPGFGLHAAGAGLALALAGVCLREPWSGAHPAVVIPASLAVAVATWRVARRSWRATRNDPLASSSRLVGRTTTVLHAECHDGHAVVTGQIWPIRDPEHDLRAGGAVQVLARADDLLIVGPAPTHSD